MTVARRHSGWTRFLLWTRRVKLARNLTFALTLAAVLSGIVTYVAITRSENPFGPDLRTVLALILTNLVLLLALVAIVSRGVIGLYAAVRKGSVGSRLQTRTVAMFSLVTIVPTVIVSVFSALFFNFGIQSWFDERISVAIEESVAVAEAYLQEHKETIRSDALSMADSVDRHVHLALINPLVFGQVLSQQADLRGLTEAIVFQRNRIVAQTQLSFTLAFDRVTPAMIEQAARGEVVVIVEEQDQVSALIKLHNLPDAYLLIGRLVDSKVLSHMDAAEGGVGEYRRLKGNVSKLQIQFYVVFVLVALILLLVAVWYGMIFAARLVVPVTRLIKAAERVRGGDFSTRVEEGPADDEVGTLGRAFNRMTGELEQRRRELVEANRQLDARRRFTEAVLAGVSAGIIALDTDKRITLHNRTACKLLFLEPDTDLRERDIAQLLPNITTLLQEAEKSKKQGVAQAEITTEKSEKTRTLLVRVTVERYGETIEGFIVTIDDITELVLAQRQAAWSDVARRVAHEIKNPLTPIKLAAERLRKKYGPTDEKDKESYLKYTDTISKHVSEIGKMVDEFVSFARMPPPVFKREDMIPLLRKAAFSQQTAHPELAYELKMAEMPVFVLCDEQQMSQMFTNLLKNAAEAIEGYSPAYAQGRISIECFEEDGRCMIVLQDNGPGFPPEFMHRILEPYVTTREKGTGLGLAIVKKIIEDHKGNLELTNAPEGGAKVIITFPIDSDINVT